MNAMRNYNVYIEGMSKTLKQKLFFLEEMDVNEFKTIIDFGCGSGDVLLAVSTKINNSNINLIGIDHDDYMLDITYKKIFSTTGIKPLVSNCLKREMITDKTLIIFNSVLHEVEEYWLTLKSIIQGTGATVVVRDMRYTENDYSNLSYEGKSLFDYNFAKVVKSSNPSLLSDFINRYGMSSFKDLTHYLLKYSYIDNWVLELKENYFSFDWNELESMGKILFKKCFFLDYKKERISTDFGIIDLDKFITTHCELIIKLEKE